MIDSVTIKNLRGIAEGRLEGLAPLTILTGPNASGKSTVLDALLIGASPAPEDAVGRAVTRHPLSVGGGRWLFGDTDQRAEVSLSYGGESRSRKLHWHERCDGDLEEMLFARRAQGPYSMIKVRPTGTESLRDLTSAKTGFSVDNQYAGQGAPQFAQIGPQGATRFVRLIDPGIPIPLHRTYSEVTRSDRREAATAVLKDFLPDFEELIILVDAGDRPVLHIQRAGQSIPVPLAGDGVQAFMQQLLEISMMPEGLALMEEPEVYQHPRAIWRTAQVLLHAMSRGIQVILSTHSLELIDGLLAQSTDDDLDRIALHSLKLDRGALVSSVRRGEEVAFARRELEKDLR